MPRYRLTIEYDGRPYRGFQAQALLPSVQGEIEKAVLGFTGETIRIHAAGRTDTGVHAFNQVVHLDSPVERDAFSWLRGTNRHLPADIALQWCQGVPDDFHARYQAHGRRYRYLLLDSPMRPALESGQVGWYFRPLQIEPMREAATVLVGDFGGGGAGDGVQPRG